jgi:hypothetical protein
MRWRKFLPANAAGGIVWAGIYTAVSYLAGNWLQRRPIRGPLDGLPRRPEPPNQAGPSRPGIPLRSGRYS